MTDTVPVSATPSARSARLEPSGRLLRRLRRPALTLFVVALIVRVAVVLATPAFRPATDSAEYDATAVTLVRTGHFPESVHVLGGPTAYRGPVFPILLAGAYELSGTSSETARWRAGRLLEAVLGAIAVALIFLIADRLWGRLMALVAGAIAAVDPPLLLVGSSLMSESVYIPLVLGAVLTALIARDSPHRERWAAATGLLIALAALTRGTAIFLIVPTGFLLWDQRPRWSRAALRSPAIMLATALVALTPWTVRNYDVFHRLVPVSTESGFALAGTYNPIAQNLKGAPALWVPPGTALYDELKQHPTANEARVSSYLDTTALHYIEHHPASVLKTAWYSALRLFNLTGTGIERFAAGTEAYPVGLAELSVYAFWVAGLLALVGAATAASRRVPWSLWGVPLTILLSTVFAIGLTRYRAPADPFIVMLAALGAAASVSRGRALMRSRRAA